MQRIGPLPCSGSAFLCGGGVPAAGCSPRLLSALNMSSITRMTRWHRHICCLYREAWRREPTVKANASNELVGETCESIWLHGHASVAISGVAYQHLHRR